MANNANINNFLIPNVSKLPGQKKVNVNSKEKNVDANEFKNLLQEQIGTKDSVAGEKTISLTAHAAKRIQERNLAMDSAEIAKLNNAFKKLEIKGGRDSLVITDKAAYIVDVANRKVVTAMDKGSLLDNVFTKIDSTVVV